MAVVRKSWIRHASRGGVVRRSCSGPFNQSRRSHAEVVPCDRYTKYYKSHGAVCLFQSRRRHRVHGAPCDWGIRQRLQCAVVCIQETHRGPDAIRPSIPGMDLAIERPHSQYGSAIFVTSGTIVNTTPLTDINNIEILRVDLNGISVTSVHKLPGERFSFHQALTAVGDQQEVIIGDFNSHSSTWGYAMTNTDGELVEDWAENQR